MKKSRNLILAISAVFCLLVVLATLQYVWLGQIADAERARLQARLQNDAKRFAEDFNKEIRNIYLFYQTGPNDQLTNDWATFRNRYIIWKTRTAYPQLIEDFYFIKKEADQPLRYSFQTQNFEAGEWNRELSEIRQMTTADEKATQFEPTVVNSFIILMPNFAFGRADEKDADESHVIAKKIAGYLVVKLDEKIVQEMLADLNQKYFSMDATMRYDITVSNKSDARVIYENAQDFAAAEGNSDVEILLFDLSANKFTIIADSKLRSSDDKILKFPRNSPLKARITESDIVKSPALDDAGDKLKEVGTKGMWLLSVRHANGSLEDLVGKTRDKNLLISFSVLSLLAISIGLVFISARRAQSLAQRQLDFVSAVSHEFRTPLAVIYSAGENLTDGVVNSQKQTEKYGNLIKGEGRKLTAMVEQILEFAGARSGKQNYNFRATNIEEIIEDALAECQSLIDEKGFILEREIAENLPAISADPKALSRAIQNLIINSIKYSNGSRQLKISIENAGRDLNISVIDRGIGISKKDLSRIFEPFYRAKTVVDAQIGGSGLGLSLVKQIVEAHRGKIKVESEIGKGSTFSMQFPAVIDWKD